MTETRAGMSEKEFVKVVGNVSRNWVRQLRKKLLVEGEDWWRGDMDRVVLSADGVAKLGRRLGVEIAGVGGEKRSVIEQDSKERLLVWRGNLVNPNIILCYRRGQEVRSEGDLVRVRVRDGSKYCRYLVSGEAMELEGVRIGEGLYEAVGRGPRWRGRW